MIGTNIPDWLRLLIASPPERGNGVHAWLFKVARQLHAHLPVEEICSLLTIAVDGCGRHVPDHEIHDAVLNSHACAWTPTGALRRSIKSSANKWPDLNTTARAEAIATSGVTGIVDLWDVSPTSCSQDSTDAEFFVDQLFLGNPLLCTGWNNSHFETASRESLRGGLSSKSLIVPSPMTALTGRRKRDGAESAHTLENTGPRHYLVTEFDGGGPDEQAALIWHLRQFAPLVLVLSSGGKSLHAWWKCHGIGDDITGRFMRYAVSLGADHATWTRSQFVRLPQGWRSEKECRQEVHYFDHTSLEEHEP